MLEWVADPSNEVANPGTETYADKVEYTMDEVHNLSSLKVTPYGGSATTTNFTSNAMNEYTAVGGTTHVYDSNGNLTDDGIFTYKYDFHNHLVEVRTKIGSSLIAEYEYDAVGRGRRTAKVVGSDTTRFIYHGQHVLEELDGSDTLLRLFAYADGWDNVVMMEAADVADVDNDANTTELKRFYYHTQLIGSITHVTDDDEVVVESYEYDAYGNTTIYDINSSSVSGSQIENPYMYTARRMDEESGLYHYRARAYSPKLRRFIQRDPLEYVDGPNAMAYVGGMPTRAVDPEGQNWIVDLLRLADDSPVPLLSPVGSGIVKILDFYDDFERQYSQEYAERTLLRATHSKSGKNLQAYRLAQTMSYGMTVPANPAETAGALIASSVNEVMDSGEDGDSDEGTSEGEDGSEEESDDEEGGGIIDTVLGWFGFD